jgi:minor extracellular serine protease Vpr
LEDRERKCVLIKKFTLGLVVTLSFSAVATFSTPAFCGDMDLILRQMIRAGQSEKSVPWSKALTVGQNYKLVPCIIRTTDADTTSAAIESLGGRAKIISDDIISASIPANKVSEIIAGAEVINAEASIPLRRKMNTARNYSGVADVQSGSGGTAYDGTNVVVGIVDNTLDWTHPDFLGAEDVTRIQYINQKSGETTLECTKRTIVDSSCQIVDGGQGATHGTHVTGIAAGSNGTYTGVANAADIAFVFNAPSDASTSGTDPNSFTALVLEGVQTIFEKADDMDKAAVVNLSLGTSIGAHDGTSLLEEGLTELSGEKGGRIIVGAAGNEQVILESMPAARRDYVGGLHAPINVTDGEAKGYRLAVWNGAGAVSAYVGGTMVDVWLDAGQKDSCRISLLGYTNGRSSEDFTFPLLASTSDATLATANVPFATSTTTPATATGGDVTATIDIDSADSRNNKPHASALIAPETPSRTALQTMWFDVVIRASGGDCTGNMWLYIDYASYHDFLKGVAGSTYDVADGTNGNAYALGDGDSEYTTTIPATAEGVIAVGSWMPPKPVGNSTSDWTGDNGTTYDQSDLSSPGGMGSTTGDLSSFSSLGPTADGRTKPAIVAPGEPIIAAKAQGVAVATSIEVGTDYFKNAGTSMASPHVTGIVALLLQKNNTLTVAEVRTALQQGATISGMTTKTPVDANSFGSGKIDAVSVLASVAADTSAYSGTGDLDPVPSGGSGCAMAPGRNLAPWVGLLLLPLVLIARRRRSFQRY